MNHYKIASILDEFSFLCFKYECNLLPLTCENWQEILTLEKPDLLLVESTWKRVNRSLISSNLEDIIEKCHEQHIPTIFWNKEDPLHFDRFIQEAKIFDYIFTTDLDCVPRYKELLGHERIYLLQFAAQPKLHNPIGREQKKLGLVAFAGTWYSRRNRRGHDMHILFGPALKYGLHIYDRTFFARLNSFPKIYRPYIKGGLPYEEMGSIYKKYVIFINVNTVKYSRTMFARRLFELLACGVTVISNYSLGIMEMFPEIVSICDNEEDTETQLANLISHEKLRDKRALLGQRKVFTTHTYYHRMQTILNAVLQAPIQSEPEGVSIIAWVDTWSQFDYIWDNFQRQNYAEKELVLIFRTPLNELEELYERTINYSNISVFEFEGTVSNEDSFYFGLEQVHFNYLVCFDANSYYGANFITDLMNSFKYTDAVIAGKVAYYSYSRDNHTLVLEGSKEEYQYVNRILSTVAIIKRDAFLKIQPEKLLLTGDGFFLGMANEAKLYSSDRFNFINRTYQAGLSEALIDEVCF